MEKNLLLMSSSKTPNDQRWLGHGESDISNFLRDRGVGKVTFVPYAGVTISHEQFVDMARERFQSMGFALDAVSEGDPPEMIQRAEAVVVGGGNTVVLAKLMHEREIMDAIRERVGSVGVPYLGWSAGAGVAGPTICTTNDWAIAEPPSFNTLGVFPVQINPHYRDPVILTDEIRARFATQLAELFAAIPGLEDELSNKGETRIDRINEFMAANDGKPVLGLREGAILHIVDSTVKLKGTAGAKLFKQDQEPQAYECGEEMDFLMQEAA